jgi:hypothetical protein
MVPIPCVPRLGGGRADPSEERQHRYSEDRPFPDQGCHPAHAQALDAQKRQTDEAAPISLRFATEKWATWVGMRRKAAISSRSRVGAVIVH